MSIQIKVTGRNGFGARPSFNDHRLGRYYAEFSGMTRKGGKNISVPVDVPVSGVHSYPHTPENGTYLFDEKRSDKVFAYGYLRKGNESFFVRIFVMPLYET